MQEDSRLSMGHSPGFVAAWRSVHCDVYHWQQKDQFAIVPSLFGAPTFAYLPGLNYSDLNAAEARGLARGDDRSFVQRPRVDSAARRTAARRTRGSPD